MSQPEQTNGPPEDQDDVARGSRGTGGDAPAAGSIEEREQVAEPEASEDGDEGQDDER